MRSKLSSQTVILNLTLVLKPPLHQPPRILFTFSCIPSSPLLHKEGNSRAYSTLQQRVLLLMQEKTDEVMYYLFSSNFNSNFILDKIFSNSLSISSFLTLKT